MPVLLEFDHVSFTYPGSEGTGIPAVRDVSLSVKEGEFVAVVGANGSGKSTFARLASALLMPQQGRVLVDGLLTLDPANRGRIHTSIGIVFQFPEDQIVSTVVEEDTAFGPENLGYPPGEIRVRVETALKAVGLWEFRDRSPHMLSAGQLQRLAVAGVLAMQPRGIVFDEATTMLDPLGRQTVMALVKELNQQGVAIVFITHFMEEAVQAQRVVVLDRGQVIMDGSPVEVFSDPVRLTEYRLNQPAPARLAQALAPWIPQLPMPVLSAASLLSALPAYPTGKQGPAVTASPSPGESPGTPLILVRDLGHTYLKDTTLAYRALDGVSLAVPQGATHGLVGMTGSGKSTLLQHLNGLLRPQEGTVQVGLFDFSKDVLDRKKICQTVGLVFQNPEIQFFERYAGDEIAFGPRTVGTPEPLAQRVRWAMDMVGLDFEQFKDRPLFSLSGGERRKVALASTLALKPHILLLDEPTAGLDPQSRQDLLARLEQMQAEGFTLVLSSHQMEDMARLAGSLHVFYGGKIPLTGTTPDVFARQDELAGYSLEPPIAARTAQALRTLGWPIPAGVITADALVGCLQNLPVGGGR
jgi:energy-coupling factor transport system ATP-binding protein